jgi:predicted metalloprotease with PDZ domain
MTSYKSLAFGILVVTSSWPGVAQNCVTITDRPNGGCLETGCEIVCALPSARTEAKKFMPGFFVEQKAGRIIVSGVLPNSPAAIAGIKKGDELLGIDNSHIPFDNVDSDWQEAGWHTVRFRRGKAIFTEGIRTESVQNILADLPALSNPIHLASFSREQNSFKIAPFLSGMLVRADGAEFVVAAVLMNSPAERAGIKPGDRLRANDGETATSLQYSNERRSLKLSLGTNGRRQISLRFASLPELLQSAAEGN